jgi:hypothetical protein
MREIAMFTILIIAGLASLVIVVPVVLVLLVVIPACWLDG